MRAKRVLHSEAASYCGNEAKQCFIVRRRMKHVLRHMKRTFGAWSSAVRHEAKPDGFMFFCPSGQKTGGERGKLHRFLQNSLKTSRITCFSGRSFCVSLCVPVFCFELKGHRNNDTERESKANSGLNSLSLKNCPTFNRGVLKNFVQTA